MASTETKSKYMCRVDHPMGLEMHEWNRIWMPPAHLLGLYGIWLTLAGYYPASIVMFSFVYGYFAGLGVTAGCHRYWSHKTYKAKLPLQIFLMIAQTAAGQHSIFKWSRDHRIHHKYTETDADPYNAKRGFWFAHVGWLVSPEHPAVREKEDTIDLTDLDNDPVVRFQSMHYRKLELFAVFILPLTLMKLISPETVFIHMLAICCTRYVTILNFTWLVNSAAHLYGYRPYDKGIFARENRLVAALAIGEGWHNYHHVFPWDYKAAELGTYGLNWTSLFLDVCAWLGLAYDLKTVPHDVVMKRVQRTGDIDEYRHHHETQGGALPPWGWGDKDIPADHFKVTQHLKAAHAS